MKEIKDNRPRESQSSDSSSFLVRMWREPQSEGNGPVRVYMRNLKTGEELYLGDPKRVGEILDFEADVLGQDEQTDGIEHRETNAQTG